MKDMIFPEIFDGYVLGFFSDRELGIDVEHITGRRVYFPIQTHSAGVKVLESDLKPTKADAVVTIRRDILLGVQTADCVPMLLLDRDAAVIGAVHAGWKGTAKAILKKTITKMQKKFNSRPEDILLAIGPAIRWLCYEVGSDVLEAVVEATGEGEYYSEQGGKNYLDLQLANVHQARTAGVREINISVTEDCTYCYPDRYHSYRRSKEAAGRQGGFIGFP
jgi:YfiH family protein